jgi:hypothetical protein
MDIFCKLTKRPKHWNIQVTLTSFFLVHELHILEIFAAVIVLLVKRREDIFVGFSRLDELIKVSVFQRYKAENQQASDNGRIVLLLNDRIG